jgi:hypothetical protein
MHESFENGAIEFKSELASKVFDSLADAFIEDYMVKKYFAEKSGWRTLAEISAKSHISLSALYGKHSTLGPALDEPIRRGVIESRISRGERGRGGEVLRLRIASDKKPVKELVHKRILHGRNAARTTGLTPGQKIAHPDDPLELKITQFLSQIPIFSSLGEDKILEIAKVSEKVSFPSNEFIVHEGDLSSGFF